MTDGAGRPLLDGLRVVDFGHYIAGPGVGRFLADFGAAVVKVDRPDDPWRGNTIDIAANRGKERRSIDLRTPAGRAQATELIDAADVVIENFRPGVMEKMGLAYEDASRRNSRVVWLAMPGFPTADLERSRLAGWETVVAAACGLLSERGLNHKLRRSPPAVVTMPMASAYAVAFGSLAVCTGLLEREFTGRGDSLEVSLYGALLEGLGNNHLSLEGLPERYQDRRQRALEQMSGSTPGLAEETIQTLIDPLYRGYRCADDRWFYLAVPPHRGLVTRTLQFLGLWEALLAEGLPSDNPYSPSHRWRSSAEGTVFGMPSLADHWSDRLRAEITKAMIRRTSADWEAAFAAAGLVGCRIATDLEWLEDPRAREAGLVQAIPDPRFGPVIAPGPFAWTVARGSAARELVHRSEAPNSPLAGLRVLDLTNVLAGPTVAGNLVRFGAEVIKIDPPTPEFDPTITMLLPLAASRGKRSLLLDLKTAEGGKHFEQLVRTADLVVHNGTNAQLRTLGIDFPSLERLRPGIVLCQLSAFGGPTSSVLEERKGFDEILQAATGIIARTTEPGIAPEEFAQFGTVDVITGVLGSAAAVAGLLASRRHQRGAWIGVSLAAGASLIQWPHLCRRVDTIAQDNGSSLVAAARIVMTADGAVAMNAHTDEMNAFLTSTPNRTNATTLEWCAVNGVAAQPLESYSKIRARHARKPQDVPSAASAFFIVESPHPAVRCATVVGPCAIRAKRISLNLHPPAPPKPGSDSRAILSEIGLSAAEIDELMRRGVAAETWPEHIEYLPC